MTLSSRHYIVLGLLAFLLALPGRLSLPPLDRDEPRYMQATAQMLATGNFLDIRFQDQPRYHQPAGIYWLEAGAVKITEFITHDTTLRHHTWPYRLPSLVASILSTLLTAWIGARLFGPKTGLLAAGFLLVTPLFAAESRMATIDSVLLLDILCLQALLLRHFEDARAHIKTPCGYSILYWCALGMGLMLKGPIVLIPSFGTLLALCLATRTLTLWRHLRPAWGWIISALIVLPWCISIAFISHGEFFRRAVGHNLLGKITSGQEAHGFPPGYYLLLVSLACWPCALYALRALPTLWQKRKEPELLFLLCWIIPHWLFFECLATKLPHYVLPTYPAIAILTAASLLNWPCTPLRTLWAKIGVGIYATLWLSIGLLLSAAVPLLLYAMEGHFFTDSFIPLYGSLPLLIATGWFIYQQKWREGAFCSLGAALLSEMGLFLCLIPHLTSIQLSPRIAHSFEQLRPCQESPLLSPSYKEPSLIFLTGGATRILPTIAAAQALHEDAHCALALIDQRDEAEFLHALKQQGESAILYDQFEGLNYSNGRKMHLRLYAAHE